MKREIKFRAWNDVEKKMEGPHTVFKPYEIIPTQWSLKNYHIMQSTGVEVDDEELYEGDIVDFIGGRGIVRWDTSGAAWGVKWNGHPEFNEFLFPFLGTSISRIGNIYEDPEALAE